MDPDAPMFGSPSFIKDKGKTKQANAVHQVSKSVRDKAPPSDPKIAQIVSKLGGRYPAVAASDTGQHTYPSSAQPKMDRVPSGRKGTETRKSPPVPAVGLVPTLPREPRYYEDSMIARIAGSKEVSHRPPVSSPTYSTPSKPNNFEDSVIARIAGKHDRKSPLAAPTSHTVGNSHSVQPDDAEDSMIARIAGKETRRPTTASTSRAVKPTSDSKKGSYGDSIIQMISGKPKPTTKETISTSRAATMHARGVEDHETMARRRLMEVLTRKTEEDEYLEASHRNIANETPWMQGSIIRIDDKPAVPPKGPLYHQEAEIPVPPPHKHGSGKQDEGAGYVVESVIDAGTFIAADTFVVSNDPGAKTELPQDQPNAEDEGPKASYGCLGGCMRDRHLKHAILYFGNVIFLFAWWVKLAQWNKNDCDYGYYGNEGKCTYFFSQTGLVIFVWLLMFGLFLTEFFCSSTGKYLRNINKTEDILDYMARLYKTEPSLAIKIECYHYETRVVYYTDSHGNICSRTVTYPVVTYTEVEGVYIVNWEDVSAPLAHEEISQYEVTKVKVYKTFTGDENFNNQCKNLIERNKHRDAFYNFYTFYEIDGFKTRVLAFVDLDKIPDFLSYSWCLWAHLTLFASFPYRMWMSSITGKVDTTVHKNVWTANPRDPTFLARALLTAALREAMATGGATDVNDDAADDENLKSNPPYNADAVEGAGQC